jgi:hypothetical protein
MTSRDRVHRASRTALKYLLTVSPERKNSKATDLFVHLWPTNFMNIASCSSIETFILSCNNPRDLKWSHILWKTALRIRNSLIQLASVPLYKRLRRLSLSKSLSSKELYLMYLLDNLFSCNLYRRQRSYWPRTCVVRWCPKRRQPIPRRRESLRKSKRDRARSTP